MSQTSIDELIAEKIRFDYRERLKKIQTNIKNDKSISRIDESYLKKVLDLESLPIDFIKKNEMLRKKDVYLKDKPRIMNEIMDEQTKKSLNENLYQNKLKSEVEILKEQSGIISKKKQKFHQQIDEFKKEKDNVVIDLQSELKNITSQMSTEKANVEKQESEINNLNIHYQKTISELNDSISVAKKEYDDVIKKREHLVHEMQSLKQNYDIATKIKNESEHDLMSEKNLQLTKANKIHESITEITQQNESLNQQINNQIQIKNQNVEQTKEIEQKIIKQDSLLKIIDNLLTHIQEEKRLSNELLTTNKSYSTMFDEKLSSINNMKNLINESLELLTKNTQKNN